MASWVQWLACIPEACVGLLGWVHSLQFWAKCFEISSAHPGNPLSLVTPHLLGYVVSCRSDAVGVQFPGDVQLTCSHSVYLMRVHHVLDTCHTVQQFIVPLPYDPG